MNWLNRLSLFFRFQENWWNINWCWLRSIKTAFILINFYNNIYKKYIFDRNYTLFFYNSSFNYELLSDAQPEIKNIEKIKLTTNKKYYCTVLAFMNAMIKFFYIF